MTAELYSIRMRAAKETGHISGAERLATADQLPALAAQLVERALHHARGNPDAVRLAIDALPAAEVLHAQLPDITTVVVVNVAAGRSAARSELLRAGVSPVAADGALSALAAGAAPDGGVMRGAMLVDAASGARLEPDPCRGVRVSRMDLSAAAEDAMRALLRGSGRDTVQLREALALAGKVLLAPGIVAELCWSDDPDYTAGYVASPQRGYVRFPHLKERGSLLGGRAFFCRPGVDREATIAFLEAQPVLFATVGRLRPDEVPLS